MIEFSVVLNRSPDEAFTLFTERISEWWPPSHRLTKDAASRIILSADGTFRERASDGREVDLGRVRIWEPPTHIALDFFLGTGSESPTDVLIVFAPEPAGTRVSVRHQPGDASAALWQERVARFETSWPLVLAALERQASAI
jgi:uncharacterized protein YndB with AHSA1/START domain